MALVKSELPKSKGGRKPTELDSTLLDELVAALKAEPKVKTDDGERPAAYGPDTTFDTEGKASGQARRYKEAAEKALKVKMRVNVYPATAPKDGETATGPYLWRIYIPLKQQD